MAKDRGSEAPSANQSKRPAAAEGDSGDQPQQQQQQHPPQQYHRVRSQKHIVGGGTGGRVHVRVPSSKGLHKYHATTSAAKLNRRQGSVSPDRGIGLAQQQHRRTVSDLKLARDALAGNLKKNTSHTNLKRNRSHVDVGKRTKSTTALHRSVSNPAVNKLKSSGASKVHFNLGGDGPADDDQEEEEDDDEWVDASTSDSPLLSRRGSAVGTGQISNPTTGDEDSALPSSPTRHREEPSEPAPATTNTQSAAQNLPRNKSSHNQYLTSRLLSRTPSHGAPPMMSTETVSVRPASSRQPSPSTSSPGQGPSLSGTPGTSTNVRPGSSGKAELTSRFVGNNSHEAGSGTAGESFILAANRGGLSRAALTGKTVPRRRQSLGSLSQARGIDALNRRQGTGEGHITDDDDAGGQASRPRRSGEYVVPPDLNRTQQKLNLQRASSSIEPTHPHPGPLIGIPTTYDSRDPRIGKLLERTGMEYLTVRRHLNPVARSISRVMQLSDIRDSQRIPQQGPSHSAKGSDPGGERPDSHRELRPRDPGMADLANGQAARRSPTPRGGAFSALGAGSASSSLGSDGGASRMHERQGLSGSSLVDGTEDAETVALLRMMWDKNMDLSASQD